MRDPETISIALTAAETGHLVFSTLHTVGEAKTIDRIVDMLDVYKRQGQDEYEEEFDDELDDLEDTEDIYIDTEDDDDEYEYEEIEYIEIDGDDDDEYEYEEIEYIEAVSYTHLIYISHL